MRGSRDEPLGMPALGCIVSNAILKRIELLHCCTATNSQTLVGAWGSLGDVRVHCHAMGSCSGIVQPCHGGCRSRGDPSFACNGACSDRPSTERQIDASSSNPTIGQEACDGHLSYCSSLSYICSPHSFAKVLRRFKSLIFRFGISTVRGRAHGPDPDQLLSNARSLFGNPWRLWLQIAC